MPRFDEDMLQLTPLEGCIFKQCRVAAQKHVKLCPRHAMLVGLYGMAEAENLEFGYRCDSCAERRMNDKPEDCQTCQTEACSVCRASCRCCKETELHLESQANDLEEESEQLREQLMDLREKMAEVVHA